MADRLTDERMERLASRIESWRADGQEVMFIKLSDAESLLAEVRALRECEKAARRVEEERKYVSDATHCGVT